MQKKGCFFALLVFCRAFTNYSVQARATVMQRQRKRLKSGCTILVFVASPVEQRALHCLHVSKTFKLPAPQTA